MKISIAACDDNRDALLVLAHHTRQYFQEKGNSAASCDYELDLFSHPDQLLLACRKKQYQLFLLDILMPMVNGVRAAQEIQAGNPAAYFIFFTSSEDYPFEAYSVNTLHYLKKPISFPDFQAAMDRFFLRRGADPGALFQISDENGHITRCPARELLYISVSGKYCLLHTTEHGLLPVRSSMRELAQKLTSYTMLTALGASYLINMDAVRKVEGTAVTMKNREQLFFPAALAGNFRKQFLSHFDQ